MGLRMALDQGLIRGPRYLFTGRALTQTGGHGDPRPAHLCIEHSGRTVSVDGRLVSASRVCLGV